MAKRMNLKRGVSSLARRQYILEQVKLHGYVLFSDIAAQKGFSAGWQSLKGDAEFFKALKLGVELKKGKFIRSGHNVKSTYEDRKSERETAKKAIGELSGALIWGTSCDTLNGLSYVTPSKEMILNQLDRKKSGGKNKNLTLNLVLKLRDLLIQYWNKKHRYVAIDAGTTNEQTAQYLSKKEAPDSAAGLSSLTILTNAPHIENILEDTSTDTEVVMIGGQLRKDTLAYTGLLSDQCLNAWQIQFDVALVGTTSLDMRHGGKALCFACDSVDEARTKGLLLEKADIRCVVMDSSKCGRFRSSAFIFAPVSNNFIDLIITDKEIQDLVITDDGIRKRTISEYKKHKSETVWDAINRAGVGILVA
jgi:DeoR/GlpR family transcriptional regulator of sugar metabolism